ncbi:MAG: protein kinase [Oscillospiraceae bacterium]|nr:protein kinase [Oscillospiraceae bacterium]
MQNLCLSCMADNMQNGVCPKCNTTEFQFSQLNAAPHLLRAGSELNGKYVVGKVIGEGGFGITYVGYDKTLTVKVAIKEYYPRSYASRNASSGDLSVYPLTGEGGEYYADGKDKFIDEARRLAKFAHLPGIVAVKDFFEANGTAYIIMEFVNGATMKHSLAQMGGKIEEAHVLEMMRPLVKSLAEIHNANVIHRDIKPDNIMIQYPDGGVKLIDFGAAREIGDSGDATVAVASHGYAPEEQYDPNRDRNGPWTDVYSLCATIFHAIEGAPPPNAFERLRNDTFSGFTVPVSPNTKAAIEMGLQLQPQNRWQNVAALSNALYSGNTTSVVNRPAPVSPPVKPNMTMPVGAANATTSHTSAHVNTAAMAGSAQPPKKKSKTGLIIGIVAAAVGLPIIGLVIAAVVGLYIIGSGIDDPTPTYYSPPTTTATPTTTTPPETLAPPPTTPTTTPTTSPSVTETPDHPARSFSVVVNNKCGQAINHVDITENGKSWSGNNRIPNGQEFSNNLNLTINFSNDTVRYYDIKVVVDVLNTENEPLTLWIKNEDFHTSSKIEFDITVSGNTYTLSRVD